MTPEDWQRKFLNQIVCGDCLDLLKELPDKCVDLVLTDPPYGMGERMQGGTWGTAQKYADMREWDHKPSAEYFDEILRVSEVAVIWGGNYFGLPESRCWLVWDKQNALPTMADCELAWTNLDRPTKRMSLPVGISHFGHPTEKPLLLMEWCLRLLPKNCLILDPFCGSGTTCVAAKMLGRKYIGIDVNPNYVEISRKRLEAVDTGVPVKEARAGQMALFGGTP